MITIRPLLHAQDLDQTRERHQIEVIHQGMRGGFSVGLGGHHDGGAPGILPAADKNNGGPLPIGELQRADQSVGLFLPGDQGQKM